MDFYETLVLELESTEEALLDAEAEGWTDEAIEFQKKYIQKLTELRDLYERYFPDDI